MLTLVETKQIRININKWNNTKNTVNIQVHILSPDRKVNPARNSADGRRQDFVTNDDLLLPILQAFTQLTRSMHANRNARYCLCICVCSSKPHASSILVVPPLASSPPHRISNSRHPVGAMSWSAASNYWIWSWVDTRHARTSWRTEESVITAMQLRLPVHPACILITVLVEGYMFGKMSKGRIEERW